MEVLMSKVVTASDLWGIGGRAWLDGGVAAKYNQFGDGMDRDIVDKGTHWCIELGSVSVMVQWYIAGHLTLKLMGGVVEVAYSMVWCSCQQLLLNVQSIDDEHQSSWDIYYLNLGNDC